MKFFVYGTLKNERILEDALGEHHGKPMTKTTLRGYVERPVHYDHESWPTLWSMGHNASVPGDLIEVSDAEMDKLTKWESNYVPKEVKTDDGPAIAFVFERPGVRKVLGGAYRFREADT